MELGVNLPISGNNKSPVHRGAVERVILEMRDRLADPLSLQDMARIACLSSFHFDRIFHQTTGIPPVQFLYALRIEAAKRLLLTTARSVTDVCYEVGYNSLGTFTRRFTQLVGLSPRKFRSLALKLNKSLFESWSDTNEDFLPPGSCVTGQLITPGGFAGIVFLGLFPTQIPQSNPIAGTLMTTSGPFHIGPLPDGKYFLFAAAFPHTEDLLAYLLPEPSTLFVGSGERAVVVRNGESNTALELRLRETRTTDPPILISLPFLLAMRSEGIQSGTARPK